MRNSTVAWKCKEKTYLLFKITYYAIINKIQFTFLFCVVFIFYNIVYYTFTYFIRIIVVILNQRTILLENTTHINRLQKAQPLLLFCSTSTPDRHDRQPMILAKVWRYYEVNTSTTHGTIDFLLLHSIRFSALVARLIPTLPSGSCCNRVDYPTTEKITEFSSDFIPATFTAATLLNSNISTILT